MILVTLLAFAVLSGVAAGGGGLIAARLRSSFHHQTSASAADLLNRIQLAGTGSGGGLLQIRAVHPALDGYAAPRHATIRLITRSGEALCGLCETTHAPDLGSQWGNGLTVHGGYEVADRVSRLTRYFSGAGQVTPVELQYALPLSIIDARIARLRLALILAAVAVSGATLLGATLVARRRA